MLVVGERCNILNPVIHRALASQDEECFLREVMRQVEAGVHGIELNFGASRMAGVHWLPWAVELVKHHSDVTLFLTASAEALAEGLKAAGPGAWINGATADRHRLESMLAAADCFDAGVVVLLVRDGFLPATLDDIALMAEEVLEIVEASGFPVDRVMLDPVLRPRGDLAASILGRAMPDVSLFMDAIGIVRQLREGGVRTIVGLSNITLGLSRDVRGEIQRRVLTMLRLAGLSAAIVDPMDQRVMSEALSEVVEFHRKVEKGLFDPVAMGI